jgi:hypothetical protein
MSGPVSEQENHETTPLPDAAFLSAAAEEAETWRVKEQLLLAMLPHVAFEGWSPAALRAGCADAGLAFEEGALLFAGGARWLGTGLWKFGDVGVIDGFFVNGSARVVAWSAKIARKLQSGLIYHYAFTMIIGVFVLLTLWFARS